MKKPKYLSDFVAIFIIFLIIGATGYFVFNIFNNPNQNPQEIIAIITFDVFLIVALASIISMKKQKKYFYERFNVFNTSFLFTTIILTILSLLFTNVSTNFSKYFIGLIQFLFSGESGSNSGTLILFLSIFIMAVIYSKIINSNTHKKALTKSILSLIGIYLFGIIIFLFGIDVSTEFISTKNIFLLITFTIALFQFFTLFATILSTYFGELFQDNLKGRFFIIQLILGIIILAFLTTIGNNGINSLVYAITYSGLVNIFKKKI